MTIIVPLLRKALILITLTASALIAQPLIAQTAALVPAGMEGTYTLTFGSAQPGAPLANGDKLSVVLAPGGTLCIDKYLLANPVLEGSKVSEAVWNAPSAGVKLVLSDISTGNFSTLSVFSGSNQLLGHLTGSKTSNNKSCNLLGGTPPDLTGISEMFRLAEQIYSAIFPKSTISLNNAYEVVDGFIGRQYPGTGTAIGIKNGTVYVTGGQFGNSLVSIGALASTVAQLRAELTGNPPPPPVQEPVIVVPAGDYRLKISGTVAATIFGFTTSQPFSLSIDSIPAPGSADIDKLEQQVRDSLKGADGVDASSFSNFRISEVSVSDSRVFFRAQFSASFLVNGINATQSYNITYDYTKK